MRCSLAINCEQYNKEYVSETARPPTLDRQLSVNITPLQEILLSHEKNGGRSLSFLK